MAVISYSSAVSDFIGFLKFNAVSRVSWQCGLLSSHQCCSRLLAEYSDLLGLDTEQDVVILGDELESGDPADLIQRVEDLLGKTKAKDGAPKSVRLKDGSGKKWFVKETFRSKESEQLLLRRTQVQEKSDPSDLRVEVSEPGRRKIINMSESGSSNGGLLEAQEAALEEVMTDRGQRERRRSRDPVGGSRDPGGGRKDPGGGRKDPGGGRKDPGGGSRDSGGGRKDPGGGSKRSPGRSHSFSRRQPMSSPERRWGYL